MRNGKDRDRQTGKGGERWEIEERERRGSEREVQKGK